MKHLTAFLLCISFCLSALAQLPKVYDESIDPMVQLDQALKSASEQDKYVLAQVGGNWCPWCLRLAQFVKDNEEIKSLIENNFVYIHLNYPRTGATPELTERIANAGRFGYPVLVIYSRDGNILHIQDTGLLESGQGYDVEKILRTLSLWAPQAAR